MLVAGNNETISKVWNGEASRTKICKTIKLYEYNN